VLQHLLGGPELVPARLGHHAPQTHLVVADGVLQRKKASVGSKKSVKVVK
jgi:hypothetical protein